MPPDNPLTDYLAAAIQRAEALDDALVVEWLHALRQGECASSDRPTPPQPKPSAAKARP